MGQRIVRSTTGVALMVFENMADLISMCNEGFSRCHGVYVWSSYALGLSVIAYNLLTPIIEKRRLLKQHRRRKVRESL